jgi:hypothetical protein
MVLDTEDCLRQVMAIRGAIGATLVDYTSGMTICSAGRAPSGSHQYAAAGLADMVHATMSSAAFASVGESDEVHDIVVTAGNGYHLVHFVAGQPDARMILYVWLDRLLGNLAMAQRGMRTTAADLVAT